MSKQAMTYSDTRTVPHLVVLPKRDTSANLEAANPYLEDGQPVFDYTRGVMRIGPGYWNELPDFTGSATDPFRQAQLITVEPKPTLWARIFRRG